MSDDSFSNESEAPDQSVRARAMFCGVVGALCGIYTLSKVAIVFPFWEAAMIVLGIWLLLVWCISVSLDCDLIDFVIGSVVVAVVMLVVVPAFAKSWQHRHQPKLPTVGLGSESPSLIASGNPIRQTSAAPTPTSNARRPTVKIQYVYPTPTNSLGHRYSNQIKFSQPLLGLNL